jgi:DDE superfamily endonuclease
MLLAFSSPPFYTKYVKQPKASDPIPSKIADNSKFFPYFADALGAVDGTHIHCSPSAAEREYSRNRKGFLSQNCLMACSFDLQFLYVVSGWDGTAADAAMFNDARFHDFFVPEGKFYLADAGFPLIEELQVPYRATRYHLDEWFRGKRR